MATTALFRSKSTTRNSFNPNNNNRNTMFDSTSKNLNNNNDSFFPKYFDSTDDDDDWENDDEDGYDDYDGDYNRITAPFIRIDEDNVERGNEEERNNDDQLSVMAILVTALRKSIVTCSVETDDVSSLDISGPTEVRHVSHVTFDRFNGFLGLPVEFEPELPKRVPSASASVFGVSAKSMQCAYDGRGNSVPTILLMMQKRLYSEGGLQAEGIFRINPENSQEEVVRSQLNRGLVPRGIDIHCLAGLIKAWFRELPTGVLDSLTPEQVMRCNTEDDCTQLVKLLPPTEAAILNWAINLMADVVEHEHENKMNARNIAMVFAPNMTQMADPLTALIHAVQVMNFLKTLILTTLRERRESPSCSDSSSKMAEPNSSNSNITLSLEQIMGNSSRYEPTTPYLLRTSTLHRLESASASEEKYWSFDKEQDYQIGGDMDKGCKSGYNNGDHEGILDRLNLRKGVRKICNHPVFQLSKPVKKSAQIGIVSGRSGDGETCA